MNVNDDIPELVPPMDEETEGVLFSQPQNAQKASKRQWGLLESVLMEHNAAAQKDQKGQQRSSQRAGAAAAVSQPAQGSFMYVIIVFAIMFGVCGLLVKKLMSIESNARDARAPKEKKKKK